MLWSSVSGSVGCVRWLCDGEKKATVVMTASVTEAKRTCGQTDDKDKLRTRSNGDGMGTIRVLREEQVYGGRGDTMLRKEGEKRSVNSIIYIYTPYCRLHRTGLLDFPSSCSVCVCVR